ncbi:HEAT repeat domain-containing protein [Nannocystis bainbridge]|uniref:HEAT repeat domain-containing protein n=1 Tax=Nannocystis bainbridge TaxID=2995303 RepID=A0ABT5DQW4_9BACT|nr:HEAT repeat domain-containing protein [Nannocystis bainbridge]MDC0715528.1 HEAT repeat domain-containing protein [Nannocystis bainbridge]
MPSLPITLEAALRDARSPDPTSRSVAVRHLAAALLAELGDPSPALDLARGHALGEAVVAALTAALDDPQVPVRAMAATGLGQLGEPAVIARIDPWLQDPDPGPDAGYLRECAAITCVLLGLASAPEHLVRADDGEGTRPTEAPPAAPHPLRPPGHVPSDLSRVTYEAALARITAALRAPAPDLRFQAAGGLVELAGRAAEPALCAALDGESHPHVRLALVSALAELDPPGSEACARLAAVVADPGAAVELAFAAALGLAAARDPSGGPPLVLGLQRSGDRARALEGLAALGLAAPPAAVPLALKLARAWLTPSVMRVRAAYALVRMAPETGQPLLDEFARSRRPAVQEAVADARAALAQLTLQDMSKRT